MRWPSGYVTSLLLSALQAGNVLRTGTALKLSMRLGPRTKAETAAAAMKAALEASPPYGARVSFEVDK